MKRSAILNIFNSTQQKPVSFCRFEILHEVVIVPKCCYRKKQLFIFSTIKSSSNFFLITYFVS